MKYRNDLFKIAKEAQQLIEGRSVSFDILYLFLLDVCKSEGLRPAYLNVRRDRGRIKAGARSCLNIDPVRIPDPPSIWELKYRTNNDYELLILARQERETIDF